MRESEEKRDEARTDVRDMAKALPDGPGLPMGPRPLAVVASVISAILDNDRGPKDSSDKKNRSN